MGLSTIGAGQPVCISFATRPISERPALLVTGARLAVVASATPSALASQGLTTTLQRKSMMVRVDGGAAFSHHR